MNIEIVVKAGGLEIPLSVAQEIAKAFKASRATVAKLQQPKSSSKPERFSLDGGKISKPTLSKHRSTDPNVATFYPKTALLNALSGKHNGNIHAVSREINRIICETLRRSKTPIIAHRICCTSPLVTKKNVKFCDEAVELINASINGQRLAPFLSAVLERAEEIGII